jgi:hypothetical protein
MPEKYYKIELGDNVVIVVYFVTASGIIVDFETLRKEGFEELSEEQIKKEPYKSIYKLPDCFDMELEVLDSAAK